MSAVALQETYRIELPIFEGPFDLLLFFIERDELDIHDIPIYKITRDFLEYIHQMERLNMEVASEFILVASTLMKIKARLLIPRPVLDADGNIEDPRRELVERLIEYKRYRAVQEEIRLMEEEAQEQFKRNFAKKEEKEFMKGDLPEDELMGIDLFSLLRTYKRLMERQNDRMARPRHVIRKYPYTVDDVKDRIMNQLQQGGRTDFATFVMQEPNKIFFVFCFLSVLELAQQKQLSLTVGKGFNNFWMSPTEAA